MSTQVPKPKPVILFFKPPQSARTKKTPTPPPPHGTQRHGNPTAA
ncbi:conserved hypothetical protein [Allochromatium vinosum DSM 180]|uniref:Uncharacterized protein n=1 Tax=Allochromatium vinosum (strain ATCC 17899 / DSM 180 / NBRC 103801 / NCIMB 10441 / D) TaxID=572477 RepID=D3RTY1_ALLVD|nr:conserved hypothetical protein [Allochromatium vinosum DSM 180]